MPKQQYISKKPDERRLAGHEHDVSPDVMKGLGFAEVDDGQSYKSLIACERCARRKVPCVIPPLWQQRRRPPKFDGDMILYNRPVCLQCQGRPCTLSTTGRGRREYFWTRWKVPSNSGQEERGTFIMVRVIEGRVEPVNKEAVAVMGPSVSSLGDFKGLRDEQHGKGSGSEDEEGGNSRVLDWVTETATTRGKRERDLGNTTISADMPMANATSIVDPAIEADATEDDHVSLLV